jgi:NAD(P)-dependent dehydrogenase (short-subunit alcohol dehydrogenase family)
MELSGRVVAVTGAASGIGIGLAARFVREGAVVIASDANPAGGADAAAGIGARFVAADVSQEEAVAELVDNVLTNEGRIDLFCSNAGIAPPMDPMSDQELWQKITDVNFLSHVWAARYTLPHMLGRGEGYLLNVTSAAGLLTDLDNPCYAATTHAAVGFAEWLAFTYRHRGIRVSALCPESVRTPLLDNTASLPQTAITVEQLADIALDAIHAERFMITTHQATLDLLRAKAVDYDGYISTLVQMRQQTRGSRDA